MNGYGGFSVSHLVAVVNLSYVISATNVHCIMEFRKFISKVCFHEKMHLVLYIDVEFNTFF